jgi:hypothetical protein
MSAEAAVAKLAEAGVSAFTDPVELARAAGAALAAQTPAR